MHRAYRHVYRPGHGRGGLLAALSSSAARRPRSTVVIPAPASWPSSLSCATCATCSGTSGTCTRSFATAASAAATEDETSKANHRPAKQLRRRKGRRNRRRGQIPEQNQEQQLCLPTLSASARDIASRVPAAAAAGASGTSGAAAAAARAEADLHVEELGRAADAAGALLSLTASPAVRRAFAERGRRSSSKKEEEGELPPPRELDRDAVESVHRAFVSVAAWLQASIVRAAAATTTAATTTTSSSSASSSASAQKQRQRNMDAATTQAVQLATRSAADLALPLPYPLYKSLAADVVAAHASPSGGRRPGPARTVLEVARLALPPPSPSSPPSQATTNFQYRQSFFRGPCVALVRRGLLREALVLLDGMAASEEEEEGFGVPELDAATALDVLGVVAEGLQVQGGQDGKRGPASIVFGRREDGRGGSSSAVVEFDPVDATELVFRLRGPLLRQLDEASRELRGELDRAAAGAGAGSAELVDLLESLSRPAADDVPDELLEDEYLEAADSADYDPRPEAGAAANAAALADAASSGPPSIYSSHRIPPGLHRQMASEMIYVRKGPAWDLPDLVEQLTGLNGGKEILYTRAYEEETIDAMMRDWEGEDEGFDDDLDGSDDDGEERER
jgi:hypothetical protein